MFGKSVIAAGTSALINGLHLSRKPLLLIMQRGRNGCEGRGVPHRARGNRDCRLSCNFVIYGLPEKL